MSAENVVGPIWSFGPVADEASQYTDGTVVPSRRQVVLLDGVPVGEIEIHLHRRKGRDRRPDLSYGITCVAFGPLPGGS